MLFPLKLILTASREARWHTGVHFFQTKSLGFTLIISNNNYSTSPCQGRCVFVAYWRLRLLWRQSWLRRERSSQRMRPSWFQEVDQGETGNWAGALPLEIWSPYVIYVEPGFLGNCGNCPPQNLASHWLNRSIGSHGLFFHHPKAESTRLQAENVELAEVAQKPGRRGRCSAWKAP